LGWALGLFAVMANSAAGSDPTPAATPVAYLVFLPSPYGHIKATFSQVPNAQCSPRFSGHVLEPRGFLSGNSSGPVAVKAGAEIFIRASSLVNTYSPRTIGRRLITCVNVSGFKPEAAKTYTVTQARFLDYCSVRVLDADTGQPLTSYVVYPVEGDCR